MLTSRPLIRRRIARLPARLDARPLALAFGALLLALVLPTGASAAPQPDRVLAEVSQPLGVGISGPLLAYSQRVGTRGVQVVVHDGDAPARRLSAGRGAGVLDVGGDRRGRPVVVYARCSGRCDLVAFSPSAGRSRVVVENVHAVDVTVGRGRIFWADGRTVRSRSLDGGPVRFEAVAKGVSTEEIDTDGRTLAVVGGAPFEVGQGASALSITRVGSGRARLRGERSFGEEYKALRGPVVTPAGVTTLFDYDFGVGYSFEVFSAGGRGSQSRTTGGMGIAQWDADGDGMVLVEAPTAAGCTVNSPTADEPAALDAPCRIVRARLGGERLLSPRIAMPPDPLESSVNVATVLQTTLAGGKVTGRRPLAGVAVQVRRGARVRARLVTDAQGHVTLPPLESPGLAVVAETTPPSYAYYAESAF